MSIVFAVEKLYNITYVYVVVNNF